MAGQDTGGTNDIILSTLTDELGNLEKSFSDAGSDIKELARIQYAATGTQKAIIKQQETLAVAVTRANLNLPRVIKSVNDELSKLTSEISTTRDAAKRRKLEEKEEKLIQRRVTAVTELEALRSGYKEAAKASTDANTRLYKMGQKYKELDDADRGSTRTKAGARAIGKITSTGIVGEQIVNGLSSLLGSGFSKGMGIAGIVSEIIGKIVGAAVEGQPQLLRAYGGRSMGANKALMDGLTANLGKIFTGKELVTGAGAALQGGFMGPQVLARTYGRKAFYDVNAAEISRAAALTGNAVNNIIRLGTAMGMSTQESGALLGVMQSRGLLDDKQIKTGEAYADTYNRVQQSIEVATVSIRRLSQAFNKDFSTQLVQNFLNVTDSLGIAQTYAINSLASVAENMQAFGTSVQKSGKALDPFVANVLRSPAAFESAFSAAMQAGAHISAQSLLGMELARGKGTQNVFGRLYELEGDTTLTPFKRLGLALKTAQQMFGKDYGAINVALEQQQFGAWPTFMRRIAVESLKSGRADALLNAREGDLGSIIGNEALENLRHEENLTMGFGAMAKSLEDPMMTIINVISNMLSQVIRMANAVEWLSSKYKTPTLLDYSKSVKPPSFS